MKNTELKIREEERRDIDGIRQINLDAFETGAEARLVDILRDSGCVYLSLVAEQNGVLVGHILFTPVTLSGNGNNIPIMGLGPMAVKGLYQRQGIGSRLVEAGLKRCRELNYDAVVVLGHPQYYPRFGFTPASRFRIRSEYDVPDEVFMLLELRPGAMGNHSGTIHYHEAFGQV